MATSYNVRSLASALGVNAGQVSRWSKRPDWPVARKGPWSESDLAKVVEWRKGLQEDRNEANPANPADAIRELGPERQWKLRLIAARVAKLEAEHKELTQKYVLKTEVEAERVARVHEVRAALMNLGGIVADLDVCRNAAEREDAVRKWAKSICDRFAGISPDTEADG